MPESPEVEALTAFLHRHIAGRTITTARLFSFAALKTYAVPWQTLEGQELKGCHRQGKFVVIQGENVFLVIHLARAGWIIWHDREPAMPAPRSPVVARVTLDNKTAFDITERGTRKQVALYIVQNLEEVGRIASLGADPLDAEFRVTDLALIVRGSTRRLKYLLTDQRVIAGVGNAYSDEILHAACLSPYRTSKTLSDQEIARLYDSLGEVLRDAHERVADTSAHALKREKRAGLQVHGRAGQACPRCGDTIREVSVGNRSFQYCPRCQTNGRVLNDRRLSRLLK